MAFANCARFDPVEKRHYRALTVNRCLIQQGAIGSGLFAVVIDDED